VFKKINGKSNDLPLGKMHTCHGKALEQDSNPHKKSFWRYIRKIGV
jgi:hypothetical protein